MTPAAMAPPTPPTTPPMMGPSLDPDDEVEAVLSALGALVDEESAVEAVTMSETLEEDDTVSFLVVEAHFVNVLLFVAAKSLTMVSLVYTLCARERLDSTLMFYYGGTH